MVEIKYPPLETYFIAYTNQRLCPWGVVLPQEVMSSGQQYLFTTINILDWYRELKKYSVVWGYQFNDLTMAEFFKDQIDQQYGEGTAQIEFAEYNEPQFWYILGYYPLVFGSEKQSFQVFPN